jgi:phosphatidylserine decarboxylase
MLWVVIGALVAFGLALAVSWKWELGLRRIAPIVFVIAVFWAAVAYGLAEQAIGLPDVIAGVITAVLVGLTAVGLLARRFYSDPERVSPDVPGAILSPADGTVLYVRGYAAGTAPTAEKLGRAYLLDELEGSSLVSGEAVVIGIAMDYLDVHVNRAPTGGTVKLRVRRPGRFASLKRPEAILENERVTTVLQTPDFELAIVQIASRLVRRIVSFVAEGETVAGGQRIGVIRLGSQVDLVLPAREDLTPAVSPGDRVLAGVSVVAGPPAAGGPGRGPSASQAVS